MGLGIILNVDHEGIILQKTQNLDLKIPHEKIFSHHI